MITTCDEIEPFLSAWLDGELTPLERERVAAHLETCAVCRADVESLRETSRAVGTRFAELSAAAPPAPARMASTARSVPWWRNAALAAAVALAVLWIATDERVALEPAVETASALAELLDGEALELVAEGPDGVRVRSVFRRDGSAFAWEEEAGGYAGGGDANELWLHVPDGGVAWAPREQGAWLPAGRGLRWPAPLGPTGEALLEQVYAAARLASEDGELHPPDGSAWTRARIVRVYDDGSRTVEFAASGGGDWRLEARSITPAAFFHTPEQVLWDPEQVRDAAFPESGLPPWLITEPGLGAEELESLTGLGYMGD